MTVTSYYRHIECQKKAKMVVENKQSQPLVLANAVRQLSQMLYEGIEQGIILHTLEDYLLSAYEDAWFAFPWQKEMAVRADVFCIRRFLDWMPKATVVAANVYAECDTPGLSANKLSTNVPLILQFENGNYGAFLLFFKKADKSMGGKSVHTCISSDLHVMVAKAALEEQYPGLCVSAIYLRHADDTDEKQLGAMVVNNTRKSNVFSLTFSGFYENGCFMKDTFCEALVNIASQPMAPPCYECDKKYLCQATEFRAHNTSSSAAETLAYVLPEYTEMQKQVVSFTDGSLLVCAGPGSGKTATLTGRVKSLIDSGVAPETILVITFTNEAAGELRRRCESFSTASPKISTINALGYEILKANNAVIGDVKLLDSVEQMGIVKTLLSVLPPLCGFSYSKEYGKNGLYKTVCGKLNKLFGAENRECFMQKEPALGSDFYRFADMYAQIMKERGFITFDEQVTMCNTLFAEHPEIAAIYQNIYRYIMVDEAQDLNAEQCEFIYSLASKHKNLVLVGDDDQSVYGFRGASNQYMLAFPKEFPGTRTIVLNDNFRSTQNLVNAAQNVIKNNRVRIKKDIRCNGALGTAPVLLTGTDAGTIEIIIADLLSKGYSYSDIAILSTKNAPLELLHKKLSVPTVLAKSYLREDVLFLHLYDVLQLFYEGTDMDTLYHYLLLSGVAPDVPLSAKLADYPSLFDFSEYQEEKADLFYMALRFLSNMFFMIENGAGINQLLMMVAFHLGALDSASYTVIKELIEVKRLKEFRKLHEHMQYMIRFEDEQKLPVDSSESVLLITSHESKGKEFPVVIMLNDYKENSEEVRRLFYVAMTRAKSLLYILSDKDCCTTYLKEIGGNNNGY